MKKILLIFILLVLNLIFSQTNNTETTNISTSSNYSSKTNRDTNTNTESTITTNILSKYTNSYDDIKLIKKLNLNEIFTIKIITDSSNEAFVISKINKNIIKIEKDPFKIENNVIFTFKAIGSGSSILAIDKIGENPANNYIKYHIIVKSDNNKKKQQVVNKTEKKSDELSDYKIIKDLYKNKVYEQLFTNISDYKKVYASGKYYPEVILINGLVNLTLSNYSEAINNFNELKKFDNNKAISLYYLAKINYINKNYNKAIKDLLKIKNSFEYTLKYNSSLYLLGLCFYQKGLTSAAVDTLEYLYDLYKNYSKLKKHYKKLNKPKYSLIAETLFELGYIYENSKNNKDIKKAYDYYKLVINNFPYTLQYDNAKKRIEYIDQFFFKIK